MLESYQVRLLQTSFAEVLRWPDIAADHFYGELFNRSPETRVFFKEDLSAQRSALIESLELAVSGAATPDHFFGYVEDLGRRHAGYGVRRRHYDSAGAALIWMLEQVLGDGFTDDTRETWETFWERIARTMISASEEAVHAAAADRAHRTRAESRGGVRDDGVRSQNQSGG